jgi:hypothetical protein
MPVVPKFRYLGVGYGGKRALYSAEMLQTTKLLATYGRDAMEITPGCDVDFVGRTDPFRFGVWLHNL